MKPCYHQANVQRMHVVSVCLHFGKIISLPCQRPLINCKKATDLSGLYACMRCIKLYATDATQVVALHAMRALRICCVKISRNARNARNELALNYTQGPWLRCLRCVRCVTLETHMMPHASPGN